MTLYRFLVRGGEAAAVEALNEIPLARELIFETDAGRFKLGDGVTNYNDLPYWGGARRVLGISGASVTLGPTHRGAWLESIADEVVLPVTGSDWRVGDFVEICQAGTGVFTVVADTGVTIAAHTATLVPTSRYRGGVIVAMVVAEDTWRVGGAMADAP